MYRSGGGKRPTSRFTPVIHSKKPRLAWLFSPFQKKVKKVVFCCWRGVGQSLYPTSRRGDESLKLVPEMASKFAAWICGNDKLCWMILWRAFKRRWVWVEKNPQTIPAYHASNFYVVSNHYVERKISINVPINPSWFGIVWYGLCESIQFRSWLQSWPTS